MNILLLRGLAREARHWGELEKDIKKEIPNARFFYLDLPGAGEENSKEFSWKMDDVVNDLQGRWTQKKEVEKIEGDEYLLAVSLGGMISLKWAELFPNVFKGMILVNTSAGNFSAPHERLQLKVVPSLLRSLTYRDLVKKELEVLRQTTHRHKEAHHIAIRNSHFAKEKPIRPINILKQLVVALRFKAPEKIHTPMLFLVSEKDEFTDPSCSLRLAQYYNAPVKVNSVSGHDMALDDPEWLSRQMAQWIGTIK